MQKIRKNQIVAGEAWLRERAGLVLATLGIGSFPPRHLLAGLGGPVRWRARRFQTVKPLCRLFYPRFAVKSLPNSNPATSHAMAKICPIVCLLWLVLIHQPDESFVEQSRTKSMRPG